MEYVVRRGTATIAISGTSATSTEVIAGELGPMFIQVPALTGTGTVTIRGTQGLGGTVYPLTTITEANGKGHATPVGTPTFFTGTLGILVEETSGTQDAAADIVYDIYYAAKHG